MRSRVFWSPLLAAALWAMGAGREASAYDVWVETVDWVPTSSVVSVPSYVAASYVVPTTYAAPSFYATAYATETLALAPTSYVVPSSYVVPTYYETRFRRSLFGRRLIPTGRTYYATSYTPSYFPTTLIYPTSYVVPTTAVVSPTVYDREVVATAYLPSSGSCCGEAVLAPTSVRMVAPESSTRAAAPPVRRAPAAAATAEDELDEAPSLPSTVDPAPPAPRPRAVQPAPVQSTPKSTAADGATSPPAPQAPAREQSTVRPGEVAPAPAGPAPKADDAPAPSSPAGADGLIPAPEGNLGFSNRREALRPVYDPARAIDPARRNVLFGRVRERSSSEPEEGVRVLLTNRAGTFDDRTAMTDAFGRFAVRVPDGDWTVQVAMPSGRVYAVSEITVSNGLISDDQGRDVPSLTITR
ncbi:carboxypeptidase-like regulatory domain-containing protein [Paludisphaera mucosa]|uniref:Carboxypeptidase-like regulatory domain-containing protein n=1 Tax=Paludisphaera mucosa TaxID=3030827 RepID=A0ABT6FGZ7_9BACT|nr:carboxypeptidase-like regulatory domain-containing protein [Paludisphaera mucosa]MDG3006779.1 carboxypeptidase-like regulatory domain-containing protein [Paludisphaera mucosa]